MDKAFSTAGIAKGRIKHPTLAPLSINIVSVAAAIPSTEAVVQQNLHNLINSHYCVFRGQPPGF